MRLIVKFTSGDFVNIEANHIRRDESFIYAYIFEELVGIFDMGGIEYLYLSEKKNERIDK